MSRPAFVVIANRNTDHWSFAKKATATQIGGIWHMTPPTFSSDPAPPQMRRMVANTVTCAICDGDTVLVDVADNEIAYYLIEALLARRTVKVVTAVETAEQGFVRFREIR